MSISIPPISLPNLTVNLDIIKDIPTLFFKGALDQQNPKSFLEDFFIKLDKKLIKNNTKKIIVNFKELDFLNSSGIKEIVKWILVVKNKKKKEKYNITFFCSSENSWQEESIGKLQLLAPKIITIITK